MIIKGWDDRDIRGVCSRKGGEFYALDWRELVLGAGKGPHEKCINSKATKSKPRRSWFDFNAWAELQKHCSLFQSINSEDTVTCSVFGYGAYPIDFCIGDLLSCLTFGPVAPVAGWKVKLWKQWPHPRGRGHDPEADVFLESDTWSCAIEAKWLTDIGRHTHGETQLEIRAACNVKNQLVIAPRASRYRHARRHESIFRRYFDVEGDQYKPRCAANALGVIRVITWEQIAELLDRRAGAEPEAAKIVSYLRWRLDKLPEHVTSRVQQGCGPGGDSRLLAQRP